VSELMTFEEELGGKNVGVQPSSGADGDNHNGGPGAGRSYNANYGVAAGGGCGGHVRESLPPAFSQTQSFSAAPDNQDFGPGGGGGMSEAVGNAGQEMEVRDAAGRYRHARRAPVDENTLQPISAKEGLM
jgi:dual specificity MAP kinase phosphatase